MPSPFPGMDSWLEAGDIWPDFQDRFASEMSAVLNATLPAPYYARLQMRPEIGVVDSEGVSDYLEMTIPDEGGRHLSVEVRDPRRKHRLITFIEIVSPANKTPGPDRDSFLDKHHEVLASDASLVEIDLLRGGQRLVPNVRAKRRLSKLKPRADYLVLVSPAWTRGEGSGTWLLFPIPLRQILPVIEVPLRTGEPAVPLDLQHVFNRAYDAGPYRRGAIDYGSPPRPPLDDADYAWARDRLSHEAGGRRNGGTGTKSRRQSRPGRRRRES